MRIFKIVVSAVLFVFVLIVFILNRNTNGARVEFPKGLEHIEKCVQGKDGRVIVFYQNPGYSSFDKKTLLGWNKYYEQYSAELDFCFIIDHSDTLFFNHWVNEIGFKPKFVYDVGGVFKKSHNYIYISYLTDENNYIISICNPSLGDVFDRTLAKMVK